MSAESATKQGPKQGPKQSPSGLVTLVVQSNERLGPKRPGSGRAKAKGANPGQADAVDNPPPSPAQWSAQWSNNEPTRPALGCEDEADLTLTLSPEDAALVLSGELSPSVAYMQGRLKTAGDNALLLGLLRWSATKEFRSALERWSSDPALRPRQPAH